MEIKLRDPVKRRRPCRKCICAVARLIGNVLCPTDGSVCRYVGKKAKDESVKPVTAAEVEQACRRSLEDPFGDFEPEPKPKPFSELTPDELLLLMESKLLPPAGVIGLAPGVSSRVLRKK